MAINWGAWAGSPWRFRIGIELVSVTPVAQTSNSVTVTFDVWFNTPNTISYNGTVTYWNAGWGSGSITANLNGSNYTQKIGRASYTISPINGSWDRLDTTINAELGGLGGFTSGTAYASLYHNIGWAVPPASTGASVTRVSDTKHTLTWTNNGTNAAPVKSLVIDRWDSWTGKWSTVANIPAATTWTDTSTVPGRRYRYAVWARNSSGSATAGAYSNYISTTPWGPTEVAAVKASNGVDVIVTWSDAVGADLMSAWSEVWHEASNGSQELLATIGTWNPSTYTHPAPPNTVSHRYWVRHKTYDTPTLYGADSATSATVQLLSAPAKPTGVGPRVMDPADLTPVVWTHRPVDTTAQTAYEVQWRLNPAGAWTTTGKVTSSAQQWASPGPTTWPPGGTVEVQVRTWGQHASASPWSDTTVIALSTRPSATIVAPGAVLQGSVIAVEHGYHDPEGSPQSAAVYRLYDAGGVLLETVNIDGPGTTATLTTRAADAATYTLQVDVRDGAGLWSPTAALTFSVDYLEPPTPAVQVEWDTAAGAILCRLGWVAADPATQVAMVAVEVWRGPVLVASVAAPNGPDDVVAVVDPIPPTTGDVAYTIVAWSGLPSSAETEVVVPHNRVVAGRAWWNGGPGWSLVARAGAVSWSRSPSRAGVQQHFAGRPDPVATYGEAIERTISVSGRMSLRDGEDPLALEEIAITPGNVCYRDPRGRSFVRITGHSQDSGPAPHLVDISVAMTVVEHQEG